MLIEKNVYTTQDMGGEKNIYNNTDGTNFVGFATTWLKIRIMCSNSNTTVFVVSFMSEKSNYTSNKTVSISDVIKIERYAIGSELRISKTTVG